MEKLQIPEFKKRETVYFEEVEEPARFPLKTAALEVICGLHLAAGVAMILFVDMVERLQLLLPAIAYCFLIATAFGILASAGGMEEC